MEELLKSIWVQGGAFGLFSASGWAMFWFERKEHRLSRNEFLAALKSLREVHGKERIEWQTESKLRSRSLLDAINGNTRALTVISERVK